MNDEIKEINLSEMLFNRDERLLDYITNLQTIEREYSAILSENTELQQENENNKKAINLFKDDLANMTYQYAKEKEENERLKEDLKGQENLTKSYCKSEQGYKQRIDKAIEITENLLKTEKSGYYQIIFKKQLNILQGSDSQ